MNFKDKRAMEITQREVDTLIPYVNNTRTHSQEQVQQIASSIKEFGFTNPILIDEKNGVIAGHGRIMAAQLLGIKEVPTITLTGLTEAQIKAYIIADNKLALNAGWDEEPLKIELQDLIDNDFDIDLLGFSKEEIAELGLDDLNIDLDLDKTKEDDVPDIEENPIIKIGDLIELGQNYQHRLLCGDSTNESDVKKLINGEFKNSKVHCISDPPYGIAYDPKLNKYGMIKNDDTFLDYISLAKKYTNGFFFMWTSYQVVDEWMRRIKREFEKINNMIIWHKGGGGLGDCARTLATDFEIALVVNRKNEIQAERGGAVWDYQKSKRKEYLKKAKKTELVDVLDKLIDGDVVWKIAKDNTNSYLHPTQKPVEVNEKALVNFTSRGEVVVDLFLGSGSNLIACENLSRKCYGMELDEKYAQVIIQRYVDYTSNPMIKINGKEVDWYEYKDSMDR